MNFLSNKEHKIDKKLKGEKIQKLRYSPQLKNITTQPEPKLDFQLKIKNYLKVTNGT